MAATTSFVPNRVLAYKSMYSVIVYTCLLYNKDDKPVYLKAYYTTSFVTVILVEILLAHVVHVK